jgi:hypothetical protein
LLFKFLPPSQIESKQICRSEDGEKKHNRESTEKVFLTATRAILQTQNTNKAGGKQVNHLIAFFSS